MDVHLGTREKDGSIASISESARKKHMALLGKTGVGKTTLMYNMAFADLHGGGGFTVIDPHGSLVSDFLGVIPRSRTNDVILLNPAAGTSRIIGINILESVRPGERHLVVSSVISTIRNLWPLNWGPRSEWLLEHFLYALLESPEPVTLAALPKFITDKAYRASIVRGVTDPAILQFLHFYESQNEKLRDESVVPLLNKVSKFTSNPLLRAVVGIDIKPRLSPPHGRAEAAVRELKQRRPRRRCLKPLGIAHRDEALARFPLAREHTGGKAEPPRSLR